MAQRRMFSNRIIGSGRFLAMPPSAQALYFHLGMNADDDGVVEAYKIIKLTDSKPGDFQVLLSKEFVRVLNDDLVVVILDWREHNLIRADRKIDSVYKDLLAEILPKFQLLKAQVRADTGKLPTGRPVDNQMSAQVRLGKVNTKTDFSDEKSDSSSSLQESEEGGGEEDIVVDYTVDEDGNPRRDGFGRSSGPKDDIPRKARDLANYYTKVLIQHHNIPSEVIIRGDAVIARLKKILKDNPSLTSKKLSEYILNFVKTADTAQDAANYIFMLSPMSITKWQIDNA